MVDIIWSMFMSDLQIVVDPGNLVPRNFALQDNFKKNFIHKAFHYIPTKSSLSPGLYLEVSLSILKMGEIVFSYD